MKCWTLFCLVWTSTTIAFQHLPDGHCLKACGQVWCNGGTEETRFCYPYDVFDRLVASDPDRTGVLLRHLCPSHSPPCPPPPPAPLIVPATPQRMSATQLMLNFVCVMGGVCVVSLVLAALVWFGLVGRAKVMH